MIRGKPSLEVALFPRNDHQHHEAERWKKRDQHAETVHPGGEPDLKERADKSEAGSVDRRHLNPLERQVEVSTLSDELPASLTNSLSGFIRLPSGL
jgi:hypothetical protein